MSLLKEEDLLSRVQDEERQKQEQVRKKRIEYIRRDKISGDKTRASERIEILDPLLSQQVRKKRIEYIRRDKTRASEKEED